MERDDSDVSETRRSRSEVEIELSYEGKDAEHYELDFYDAAIALLGFQRSLAITTHFVLNNRVITQAPALRGARLVVIPPERGSWKIRAGLDTSRAGGAGALPSDAAKLVEASYDHVLARTLGQETDDNAQIVELLERRKAAGLAAPDASIERFDAVVEKCETAIRDMHRPIVISQSASSAKLISSLPKSGFRFRLNRQSYDHILLYRRELEPVEFVGRISGYNINTYKGRVYIADNKRPVPFEIANSGRTPRTIQAVIRSLAENAGSRFSSAGVVTFSALPIETPTGRLKSLVVLAAD